MNNKNENKDIRNFGIGLAVMLLAIGSYKLYKVHNYVAVWFCSGGGAVLIFSVFATPIIKPIYKIMTVISHKIGWVNQKLILGMLFYLLFVPIAVVFRLVRKDPLNRKIETARRSYWIAKEQYVDKRRYEQQF
ncbi:MAG: hypothetical protein HQK92_03385 [Nitrospirae bacterium]|nr:hypothetical protein [Nitrospirota bacterium]